MIRPKFNLKDSWYLLSKTPERYISTDTGIYYWCVYIEDGFPVAVTGNARRKHIQDVISRNALPSTTQLRDLPKVETVWQETLYSKMVRYRFPLAPVLIDDDIYQLDL